MPDDTRMLHPQPRDWSEALAALPLESPPRDAWKTIAANLHPAPAAARPDRRPLWLAIAAGVAMALVLPLFRHVTPEVLPTPVADTRDTPADATSTAETPSPDTAIAVAGTSPDPDPLASPQPATVEPAKTVDAKPAIPATRMAQQRIRPADKPVVSGTPSGPTDETALATLHAQSAQLEALLAMARDEHVASGMVAALGDELGAQVANIDAALIQPDLDARQRTELWRQRVDTLQRLVGLEATQRLYAARGQSYDVALVSVD